MEKEWTNSRTHKVSKNARHYKTVSTPKVIVSANTAKITMVGLTLTIVIFLILD